MIGFETRPYRPVLSYHCHFNLAFVHIIRHLFCNVNTFFLLISKQILCIKPRKSSISVIELIHSSVGILLLSFMTSNRPSQSHIFTAGHRTDSFNADFGEFPITSVWKLIHAGSDHPDAGNAHISRDSGHITPSSGTLIRRSRRASKLLYRCRI